MLGLGVAEHIYPPKGKRGLPVALCLADLSAR